jgi:hypothetical protein
VTEERRAATALTGRGVPSQPLMEKRLDAMQQAKAVCPPLCSA